MNNLFSIGEFAEIKEVTIKALRYYHKVGILIPKYIDKETGYRYYSIEQFIYIDIIKGCRALGTSIAELQEIFKVCDTNKLVQFLQFKKIEAQENINKMKKIIKNIDTLNINLEQSKDIIENNEIVIKNFKERHIIIVPCMETGSLKELLYYSDLEKIIQDKNISISMGKGIIYNFNSSGNIEPTYVFSEIEEPYKIKMDSDMKILTRGRYITLSYSKYNEKEAVEKIINYIKENALKVKEFIEVELFNDFFNTENYNCQIQVLIEKM
ncbi:MAG: MerR family DNA-binding transcriptional regulator [Clostridium sp.]